MPYKGEITIKTIKSLWNFKFDSSVVILDVGGGYLRDTRREFQRKGYAIKVMNLIAPQKSLHYNPFVYLKCDDDVFALTQAITSSRNKFKVVDEFWECFEAYLLASITLDVCRKQPKEEQNFMTVMKILHQIKHGDIAPDDEMLSLMPTIEPGVFNRGVDCLIVRIGMLVSPVQEILQDDTLKLDALSHQKTALFLEFPCSDRMFDSFIAMLLVQSQRCCSNIKIIDSR